MSEACTHPWVYPEPGHEGGPRPAIRVSGALGSMHARYCPTCGAPLAVRGGAVMDVSREARLARSLADWPEGDE
jgi:hypothetical protein